MLPGSPAIHARVTTRRASMLPGSPAIPALATTSRCQDRVKVVRPSATARSPLRLNPRPLPKRLPAGNDWHTPVNRPVRLRRARSPSGASPRPLACEGPMLANAEFAPAKAGGSDHPPRRETASTPTRQRGAVPRESHSPETRHALVSDSGQRRAPPPTPPVPIHAAATPQPSTRWCTRPRGAKS